MQVSNCTLLQPLILAVCLDVSSSDRLEVFNLLSMSFHVEFPTSYHWTPQRRGLRAEAPSIILCVNQQRLPAPQRRGYSHSGEGILRRRWLFMKERRGYKKIPLVEFQDIYKTDLKNSFRVNRTKLGGASRVVTQIPSGT